MRIYNKTDLPIENGYSIFSWNDFDEACDLFGTEIKKIIAGGRRVCLIGAARGALPLLTAISHQTGIRDISVVQLQMTNSDKPYDYGDVRVLLSSIRADFDDFILLEDVLYRGNTANKIVEILKGQGKNVLAVFSLIVDRDYQKNGPIIDNQIPVFGFRQTPSLNWILFPWERENFKLLKP